MLIFTSVYGVVDGFFVSNFVGKTPFTAVNFIMPFLMILGSFGFMFGTGGGALIAKTMGEGDNEKANQTFSFLVYASIAFGIVFAVFGIIFIRPIAHFLGAEVLAKPLSMIFVGYDKDLLNMTLRAFYFFSFSFLFSGFAIFGSSFFTALNDGLISALISFLRTLVFQIAAVLIFPLIWSLDGIWLSVVGAEIMAMLVTAMFLIKKRKKYHY